MNSLYLSIKSTYSECDKGCLRKVTETICTERASYRSSGRQWRKRMLYKTQRNIIEGSLLYEGYAKISDETPLDIL